VKIIVWVHATVLVSLEHGRAIPVSDDKGARRLHFFFTVAAWLSFIVPVAAAVVFIALCDPWPPRAAWPFLVVAAAGAVTASVALLGARAHGPVLNLVLPLTGMAVSGGLVLMALFSWFHWLLPGLTG
jgi:hypothetical protein